MNKKNYYANSFGSINEIKALTETSKPPSFDSIIQKSKKIIEDSSNSYEGKEPIYVMRLNNLLSNCVQEIETQIARKKESLKKQQDTTQIENSFIEQNNNSQDLRTQIEQVQIEISQSTQILSDYKKQMSELENKRIRLMDTKYFINYVIMVFRYRYELGIQIKDIQNIISGLKQYCNANREKKKRQELQQQSKAQKPQSVSQPINNLSFKNSKPQDSSKDTKDKKATTETFNTTTSQPSEKSKQTISPLKKIRSPQKVIQKASNIDITKLEVIDNNQIIEQSRYLCEEVDIINQRNARLKGKVEQLEKLIKNLAQKTIKIDKKYDELRMTTKENQVCELPDTEQRYKRLLIKCAALEKKIALNKNIYEQNLKEGYIILDQLNQTCLERSESVKLLSQQVLEIRKKNEELRQVQQTLNITLDKPLQSSIIQSNKALQKLIIIENRSILQTPVKNMTTESEALKTQVEADEKQDLNQAIYDEQLEGGYENLDEDQPIQIANDEQQEDQILNENKENNDKTSRLQLVPKIFGNFNEGEFITDVDQAQQILKDTFQEIYDYQFDPTQELAESWLQMYGSEGQLTRKQYEIFLVEYLDDYAQKINE